MRGGRREGAGRKPQADHKVQMVVTIEPETREKLKDTAKARNTTPGRLVDEMAESL